ncbi:MAG: TolC family protein [Bryobacterales bacterium]|nr:TolC family protein [Bryobacterales bacterium]
MRAPLLVFLFWCLHWGAGWAGAQQVPPPKLSLSLAQVTEQALSNNLQTRLAAERASQSRAERDLSASALLPNVSGVTYQANVTANLAALGLPVDQIPGFPLLAGPYNRFDARVQLALNIFDLASIRRHQASTRGVALAGEQQRLAAQQVTVAACLAYLAFLEAEQSEIAAQANVTLASRLAELAASQREAGVATGLDVTRAETRLASQQVQLSQARTSLDTARLNLLRLMGAPLASEVVLTDRMRFAPEPLPDAEKTVARALAERIELRVAADQLQVAEARRKAAQAERLPSLGFFGDYGSSGIRPDQKNLPTRSYGVRMEVPLFDGGRTSAGIRAAASQERQAELQRQDLRAAVEKDVRQALDHLAARQEQVAAAQRVVTLAERELELARDRFASGVADNVEITNAQTVLENARQTFVANLALYNVARLSLAAAVGHAEDFRL